ncbi:uncharacterized protein L201_001694 [Kwoniella dendrophila CBS 6074]|uniref:Uncharacterized protein n=1 Tax=Kwoniella dendrophila CBS 6074 TaxID=1295534 RepID=A0AAX4JN16_9TREE
MPVTDISSLSDSIAGCNDVGSTYAISNYQSPYSSSEWTLPLDYADSIAPSAQTRAYEISVDLPAASDTQMSTVIININYPDSSVLRITIPTQTPDNASDCLRFFDTDQCDASPIVRDNQSTVPSVISEEETISVRPVQRTVDVTEVPETNYPKSDVASIISWDPQHVVDDILGNQSYVDLSNVGIPSNSEAEHTDTWYIPSTGMTDYNNPRRESWNTVKSGLSSLFSNVYSTLSSGATQVFESTKDFCKRMTFDSRLKSSETTCPSSTHPNMSGSPQSDILYDTNGLPPRGHLPNALYSRTSAIRRKPVPTDRLYDTENPPPWIV